MYRIPPHLGGFGSSPSGELRMVLPPIAPPRGLMKRNPFGADPSVPTTPVAPAAPGADIAPKDKSHNPVGALLLFGLVAGGIGVLGYFFVKAWQREQDRLDVLAKQGGTSLRDYELGRAAQIAAGGLFGGDYRKNKKRRKGKRRK